MYFVFRRVVGLAFLTGWGIMSRSLVDKTSMGSSLGSRKSYSLLVTVWHSSQALCVRLRIITTSSATKLIVFYQCLLQVTPHDFPRCSESVPWHATTCGRCEARGRALPADQLMVTLHRSCPWATTRLVSEVYVAEALQRPFLQPRRRHLLLAFESNVVSNSNPFPVPKCLRSS